MAVMMIQKVTVKVEKDVVNRINHGGDIVILNCLLVNRVSLGEDQLDQYSCRRFRYGYAGMDPKNTGTSCTSNHECIFGCKHGKCG